MNKDLENEIVTQRAMSHAQECVCVWAVSKDVKLVSSHIILQGATGEVYSQWPTKTLYTSCVNVPALVLTVDLRFC